MTLEIIIVLCVLIGAVILFITEKLPVDLVALCVLAILMVSGILDAEEGLRGFSDEATITIASMFILSGGLFKTGVVNYVGRNVIKLYNKNFWVAIISTMVIVGLISAFINNTPVVAIFIPILLQVSRESEISASKILMPLSFASIFGGVCTLIGTSTNIVVSSVAARSGARPFTMFEFTDLGIIFFAVGIVYMIFVGIPMMPKRRGLIDLTSSFGIGEYLTEIIITRDAQSVNKEIRNAPLVTKLGIDILEIIRENERIFLPSPTTILRANDLLRIKCNIEKIKELQERDGILLKPGLKWKDEDIISENHTLVEAIIAPNSFIEGKTLKQVSFRQRFGATALAIRHRGRIMQENVATTKLVAGDALLIETNKINYERVKDSEAFVVVSEVDPPTFRKSKIAYALVIIFGVVVTATLGILPIVVSAVLGGILLILTGCISLEQAYRAIDWKIIILLAGSLSLGVALEKTGGAKLISDYVIGMVGPMGPTAILSAFYLLTLVLTEAMSNNATAALVTPIAIVTANSLGVDPMPFLVAVAFAASLAFMSPVGYQTHLLIYNPGRYKVIDFIKAGTPLDILFWLMATFLIPLFFPF
ncbi:MAG: SLC13 family permease [Ignavibacteriaceae bacterium]